MVIEKPTKVSASAAAAKKATKEINLYIKIIILGDYSVGKTSIIKTMAQHNTVIIKDQYNGEKHVSGNNNVINSNNYNQPLSSPEPNPGTGRHLYSIFEEKSCEVRMEELASPKAKAVKRKEDPDLVMMSYMSRPGIVEVEFTREEKTVRALIADTGGQERYRSMTTSYYRGAHGALLIFDVTNEESFESLSSWMDQMDRYKMSSELPIVLVGTHCNSPKRCVPADRAIKYATEMRCRYVEVDLENSEDVQKAFEQLVDEVIVVLQKTGSFIPETIIIKPEKKVQSRCPCS